MKKLYMLLVAVLLMFITGCSGNGTEPLSSDKAITAFSLGGVAGTIDETGKTIAVTMPFGTDVTALVATFTTTGASVTVGSTAQISGITANNLTTSLAYTVTAPDNTSVIYTVSVTVDNEIDFHHMASGTLFGNVLKLNNAVIDKTNRKLYVSGFNTTYVAVIDVDKDCLVETFDIGVTGGNLIFDSNILYSYDVTDETCRQIDTTQKTATEISVTICRDLMPPEDKMSQWGGYVFKETGFGPNGFPTDWRQNLNGAYGAVEIYDALKVKMGEIIHGPDAFCFTIDETTGKLYAVNSGDGSITIFDLNKLKSTNYCQENACKTGSIDIGDSAEEVIVDSADNIYVRNRLGGSVIYKYSPGSKTLTVINNENNVTGGISLWPTGIALSSEEKKLFVLSHYGALIDVVDTVTNMVTTKITFTTDLKPRTDSLSTMKIDKSRNKLYVAWPELGIIGVADGNTNTVLGTIDLTLYGFDRSKAANAGPGLITLDVSEKNDRLYAYLKNEQKTLIFDGNTLTKVGEKNISSVVVNDGKGVLYSANNIIDPVTNKQTGSFSKGQEVVGFDNSRNAVYLYAKLTVGGKKQEKLYEFIDNVYTREWTFDTILSVGSSFYFDFAKKVFYVAYFEAVIVKKYEL